MVSNRHNRDMYVERRQADERQRAPDPEAASWRGVCGSRQEEVENQGLQAGALESAVGRGQGGLRPV